MTFYFTNTCWSCYRNEKVPITTEGKGTIPCHMTGFTRDHYPRHDLETLTSHKEAWTTFSSDKRDLWSCKREGETSKIQGRQTKAGHTTTSTRSHVQCLPRERLPPPKGVADTITTRLCQARRPGIGRPKTESKRKTKGRPLLGRRR